MSSTNRGNARNHADFYATPHWVVHRLLERLTLPGGTWLEPGAGEGNIIRAVHRPDVRWTALELRAECRPQLETLEPRPEVVITDKFVKKLADDQKPLCGRRFDVALGNPPFSLALEFVQESLELADTVVMLLRLNFLGSSKRAEFMRGHTPDVYVLPNRPSFTGKGTDSIEYAWFVWRHRDAGRSEGKLTLLAETPSTERRAPPEVLRHQTPRPEAADSISGSRPRAQQLWRRLSCPAAR